jgi:hypothetical protein
MLENSFTKNLQMAAGLIAEFPLSAFRLPLF